MIIRHCKLDIHDYPVTVLITLLLITLLLITLLLITLLLIILPLDAQSFTDKNK